MPAADMIAVTAPLESLAILEVQGKDAERFLQGQCTAQLAHAGSFFAPLAAFCTPQGRMVANARILRPEEGRYWLIMHPSAIEGLIVHLQKYIPFYTAALTVRSDLRLQGVYAASPALASPAVPLPATLPGAWVAADEGYLLTIEGDRCLLWISPKAFPVADVKALTHRQWQRLQVDAGIVWLQASQSDKWLPQMINWEALGGISFKKGCYTGQEVVARAHFRGQVKRRLMHLCAADKLEGPCVGDDVVDTAAERAVGTILAVASGASEGWELLAVVALKEEMPPLSVDGSLVTPVSLPYAIERRDPEEMVAELTA